MKFKRSFSIFVFVLLLSGLMPLSLAKAITMSPVRMELAADPGKQANGVVKIYNDEKIDHTLYLSAAKFEAKDETGDPKFVPGNDGIASWIKLPDSVFVPSLTAKEVPFTIDVPEGTDPGGYFAAIFSSIAPPTPGQSSIALQNNVGTLVLFRVNGQFPEGETILEFNTKDKQKIYNHLPVEFYFRFQNSGADRAQPLGDITIKNIFGNTTKLISANKGAGNVLPESIRRFDTAWQTAGQGKEETNYDKPVQPQFKNFFDAVRYQWNNFAIGRYTANLKLVVNNDTSRSYEKSTSFWIIPWQLLVVFAAILILFVAPLLALLTVILIYWRRRRQRP